jgi:tRNA nucleotidyltransferase (CCA-adding enzyme)
METYLVGGAVRDEMLGIPVVEKDWVVVGGTENEMKRMGYRKVGSDFPVFLHPETGEEYALARTERKTGAGHTGFECDIENVTLEDDLLRRDLTINAIAQDTSGRIIDPWGGTADLQKRILRHVSPAFEEDPLRILRVARFAARFAGLGFSIADDTLSLMEDMTSRDVLAELPAERISGELDKALTTGSPETFFEILDGIDAARRLWPELTDVNVKRLVHIKALIDEPALRLSGLLSPLSEEMITEFCDRLRIANHPRELALIAQRHVGQWVSLNTLPAEEIIDALYKTDCFRQQERFSAANHLLSAIVSNDGNEAQNLEERWSNLRDEAARVTASDVDPDLKGAEIGNALRQARIDHIAQLN